MNNNIGDMIKISILRPAENKTLLTVPNLSVEVEYHTWIEVDHVIRDVLREPTMHVLYFGLYHNEWQ